MEEIFTTIIHKYSYLRARGGGETRGHDNELQKKQHNKSRGLSCAKAGLLGKGVKGED